MIVINLSEQQAIDADPITIKQIHFTGNLESNAGNIIHY